MYFEFMFNHSPAIAAINQQISLLEDKKRNEINSHNARMRALEEQIASLNNSLLSLGGERLSSTNERMPDEPEDTTKVCLFTGPNGLRIMTSVKPLADSIESVTHQIGEIDLAHSAVFYAKKSVSNEIVAALKDFAEEYEIEYRRIYRPEAFDFLLPFILSWIPSLPIKERNLFNSTEPSYPSLPSAPRFDSISESAVWSFDQYKKKINGEPHTEDELDCGEGACESASPMTSSSLSELLDTLRIVGE